MTSITRNTKKTKASATKQEDDQSDISINHQLEQENAPLVNYKQYVRNTAREISESLKKIEGEARPEIAAALALCAELMEAQ